MSSKRLLAVIFALVLVLAACGGEEGDSGTNGDSGSNGDSGQSSQGDSGSDSGGEGDGNGSGSGGDGFTGDDARADASGAGEDFPIAIPGGWETDAFAELADEGVTLSGGVQLFYAEDEFDRVLEFYDEWFETVPDPDQWIRSEAAGDVIWQRVSPLALITITKQENQGELKTFLLISAESEE